MPAPTCAGPRPSIALAAIVAPGVSGPTGAATVRPGRAADTAASGPAVDTQAAWAEILGRRCTTSSPASPVTLTGPTFAVGSDGTTGDHRPAREFAPTRRTHPAARHADDALIAGAMPFAPHGMGPTPPMVIAPIPLVPVPLVPRSLGSPAAPHRTTMAHAAPATATAARTPGSVANLSVVRAPATPSTVPDAPTLLPQPENPATVSAVPALRPTSGRSQPTAVASAVRPGPGPITITAPPVTAPPVTAPRRTTGVDATPVAVERERGTTVPDESPADPAAGSAAPATESATTAAQLSLAAQPAPLAATARSLASPAAPPTLPTQVAAHVHRLAASGAVARPGGAAVDMVLSPAGLGRVGIRAELVDGTLHVEVRCAAAATGAAVRATLDELRQDLQAAGHDTVVAVTHHHDVATSTPLPIDAAVLGSDGHGARAGHGGAGGSGGRSDGHDPGGAGPTPTGIDRRRAAGHLLARAVAPDGALDLIA